ncbi:RNA polymerase sigma factor [Actinokineospora sp. 24-640]
MDGDENLVVRARAGDADAFDVLVRRHHSAACRVAVLSGAGGEFEDVVQEAFVRAFDGLGGFRVGAAFRPWLLQIVVNQTRNLHRSRTRRVGLAGRVSVLRESREEVCPSEVGDPQAAMLASERSQVLWSALRGLPEKDRQVLGCRYLLGLSEMETAQVLDWPRGSVKSRASRALARLRGVVRSSLGEVKDHA